MFAAGSKLGGDGVGKFLRRAFDHLGVVLAQAFDHQRDAGCGAELAVADIGAGERLRRNYLRG
jgi:hypothetical protein